MIDLRRLHVLRAVAHYGTVTAAARALHFTPSAASQQVRQLARDLGVDLLEPQGRGVRLTPAAESLLAHADAIQARWDQAELDLRADHGAPSGVLRVTGFPVAVSVLLAPMAARLGERHPRLSVRITEAGVPKSFDLLFEGDTDLAIVEATPHNPPLSDTRFDQQPLLDDPFDLVVPEGHRLAGGPGSIWPRRRGRRGSRRSRTVRADRTSSPPAARPGSPPRSSITPSTGMPAPTSWPTGSASPSSRAWPI